MNSLKATSRFISGSIILLLQFHFAFGQKIKDFKWPKNKMIKYIIPDSLQQEDAVCIFNYSSIDFTIVDLVNWKTRTTETVRKRIKIQTQQAVNEFSIIYLLKDDKDIIETIDARTIKPSGKIIDLAAKEIVRLEYEGKYEHQRLKELRFAIPGVEVGDEIETIYTIKRNEFVYNGDLYLHTNLPTMHSIYTMYLPRQLKTEILSYNGMPEPKKIEEINNNILQWSMTGLVSVKNDLYSQKWRDLPYVTYVIRSLYTTNGGITNSYPLVINKWSELYKAYDNTFSDLNYQMRKNSDGLDKIVNSKLAQANLTASADKFKYLYSFINDSIAVVYMDETESNNPSGYFLTERRINHHNLHVLYRNLFKKLGLKYYVCFARNKYQGEIDPTVLAPGFVTDVFYCFKDTIGKDVFVYPSYPGIKYELNELPYYLYDSYAFMAYGKDFNALDIEVKKTKISKVSERFNSHSIAYDIKIDSGQEKMKATVKESFSGVLSSEYKYFLLKNLNDEKTLYSGLGRKVYKPEVNINKPYQFEIRYDTECQLNQHKIDTDIISISLDSLLIHNVLKVNEIEKRKIAYYPPYEMSDEISCLIDFGKPVELLNANQINQKHQSKFGEYYINFEQKGESIIKFTSNYVIKKDYLAAEDYHLVLEHSDATKKGSESKVIVRLSK